MTTALQLLMGASIVATLALFGTTRLRMCARLLGLQGLAIGLLPVVMGAHLLTARTGLLIVGNLVLKAGVFPWLLLRASRHLRVRRDPGSYGGAALGILVSMLLLGAASWLGSTVGQTLPAHPSGVYIVAFFLILAGLAIIVLRRRAVMQVMGYLTLENGIYLFGSCAVIDVPFLLEFGVVLDVFAAVFVMGAALEMIHTTLHSDDATDLSELRG